MPPILLGATLQSSGARSCAGNQRSYHSPTVHRDHHRGRLERVRPIMCRSRDIQVIAQYGVG